MNAELVGVSPKEENLRANCENLVKEPHLTPLQFVDFVESLCFLAGERPLYDVNPDARLLYPHPYRTGLYQMDYKLRTADGWRVALKCGRDHLGDAGHLTALISFTREITFSNGKADELQEIFFASSGYPTSGTHLKHAYHEVQFPSIFGQKWGLSRRSVANLPISVELATACQKTWEIYQSSGIKA